MAKKEELTEVQAEMPDIPVEALPEEDIPAETPEVNPEDLEDIPAETGEDEVIDDLSEEATEEAGEKTAQTRLTEVVNRFYPDADTSTPETLMDSLLPLVESIVSFHDDLNEVVEEFPEFGDMVIGLRNGMTPQEAIATYFDVEQLTPPEDAPDFDAYSKAKDKRRKEVEQRKEKERSITKNIETTVSNIETYAEDKGWDKEKTIDFSKKIGELFSDWADGNLTVESLDVLNKGFSFDETIAEKDKELSTAVEDAIIAGRNEKIAKKRVTKETGDGLPRLANTGAVSEDKNEDKFTADLRKIADRKPVL